MDLKTFYLAIVYGERYNASLEVYKHEIIADEISRAEAMTVERCLLYVSLTRAQREAFITGSPPSAHPISSRQHHLPGGQKKALAE